ncbi:alpha/beta-hydrolase [Pholiota conissans]|uniref:Alpha/beta-hydrolase n=1 Tax=Pholiota conissans TaxID=109636 RepID=A0A9P5ZA18_9AGAR|nr:alpha/beta-hydrolase [Pholiota conissans]
MEERGDYSAQYMGIILACSDFYQVQFEFLQGFTGASSCWVRAGLINDRTPFQIDIPDASTQLLRQKLNLATLPDERDEAGWDYGAPLSDIRRILSRLKDGSSWSLRDELDNAGWDYGAPLSDVRRLLARWKNGYDWRKYEAQINAELPQFTRDIDVEGFGALNIHYVHQKSNVTGAIPLLFVHGWSRSFLKVQKILPLLFNGSDDHPAFHVVALSLPGYGFSEAPKTKGFGQHQYAEVMMNMITRRIAQIYGPKHSKAWHMNMPMSSGYMKEQNTMPHTIGYSLADSPVGLLAWIYEKLVTWTDDYPWEDDEVLTWISIYLFSRAGPAASLRIYYEANKGGLELAFTTDIATTIPLGYSYFPEELSIFPRRWSFCCARTQALVDDVRKMFGKGGPAFSVVPGKTGYAEGL